MSARSIRRSRERARRRGVRRARRATIATGAALGAGALLAPAAQAANLQVDVLTDAVADGCDPGACTLRDAIAVANANGEADAITFAPSLSGTIRLAPAPAAGPIQINPADALTITDAGPNEITISGDANADGVPNTGDTRIFDVGAAAPITIDGLTLTRGYGDAMLGGGAILVSSDAADLTIANSDLVENGQLAPGGAIGIADGDVTIVNSTLSGNFASDNGSGGGGGAVRIRGANELTVTDSEITGNLAGSGGAILANAFNEKYGTFPGGSFGPTEPPTVTIEGSTITGNESTGNGGAIQAQGSYLEITESELADNTATVNGGAVNADKYTSLDLDAAVVRGNTSGGSGGGISFGGGPGVKYGDLAPATTITNSTIAGNEAGNGGGVAVFQIGADNSVAVDRTTVSGNSASGNGGGLNVTGTANGELGIVDSTISGNVAAGRGGGAAVGADSAPVGPEPVSFDNSTVAANSANVSAGGGIYLGRFDSDPSAYVENFVRGTVDLYSSIVGDNSLSGNPQDLATADPATSGGFVLGYSLVEEPGSAAYTASPTGTNVLDADPVLLPLADNGGPTRTHLPANTSPALDLGANPLALPTDQRGEDRTVGLPGPDPNDGTDIGAVELQAFTAPETTITGGPSGDVTAHSATFEFSSDRPEATFECSLDGAPFQSCTSPRQYPQLASGAHTFAVRAISYGAVDPTPATRAFNVLDQEAPATTIDRVPRKKIKTKKPKAKLKLAFSSSEAGATFECKVDKGAFEPCESPLKLKLKSKPGKGAKHVIQIRAIDAAGNVGEPVTAKTRVIRRKR